MKIKEIEDARSEVLKLKNNLKYFKDERRKAAQISMINVFIRLINVSERLLEQSVDKDIVDALLLRVFQNEYEKAQYTDPEGFVSKVQIEFMRNAMALDIVLGREGVKGLLAAQMAGDMLANASFLTEEEKEIPVFESPKVAALMKDATEFWKEQLDRILEYFHYKKGIWKS